MNMSTFPMIKNHRRPKRSEFAPQIMNEIATQIVYKLVYHIPAVGSPSLVETWVEITAMAGTIQKDT